MSWLYSQALVEEYLAANFSDGEQSVQSNGKHIQQAYCAPDKMMAFSRLSRFGMTFKPLTDIPGEELSMSSVVAFHVRTLVPQEKVQELTENDQECGKKWHGLLAKFDPNTHSWKTVQCSLLEDLNESLQTLPQWGMTVGGELYLLPTLAHHTNETVFGFSVPTPVASDAMLGAVIGKNDTFYTTSTGMPRKINQNAIDGSVGLSRLVQMWPTPVHSEARQGLQIRRDGKKGTQQSLTTAVMTWPTPRTAGMCGGSGSWDLLNKNTTIEEARLMGAGNGGQLNPTWVEWLMGWPLGWTDLKPLEMDKCHYVQQQHGES
jgi:hypothetical protein